MKLSVLIIGLLVLGSCVPAKKYKDLVEREKKCSEELEMYKTNALNYEGKAKDLEARYDVLKTDVEKLKADTTRIGNEYRILQAELESKNVELQRKEDALLTLEADLKTKEQLLAEREQRVNELEEAIKRKDEATKLLKAKVANALKGFESQGLTVVQKNGKIYVSMEVKLLFASGSTIVEANGKKALVELAKVLENEKELEIIVEGHTDTDKLVSASHTKSNWELTVLRATSVIDIL